MASTSLSQNDVRALLTSALQQVIGQKRYFWIADIYDDRLVYQDEQSGRKYARTYTINTKTNAVSLGQPSEVRQKTSYEPVAPASFALDTATFSTSDGGLVLRTGKVFEVGDYPDKHFALSEAEAAAAVAQFSPVPVDLEHRSTPLDGKLGQLTSVQLADDKRTLIGTVALPSWLDSALGDGARRVSLTWNRATKQIAGLALTNTPRIADAALFAAFADATGETIPTPTQITEEPARMDRTPLHQRLIAAFGGLLGSNAPAEAAEALAAAALADAPAQTPPAAQIPAAAFSQADRDEITRLRTKLAEQEAATFAESMKDKLTPAEREQLLVLYAQAALDDQAHGLATFSDADGQPVQRARVATVRALYEARPAHQLTQELVQETDAAAAAAGVLFAQDRTPDPDKPSADRVAALAAHTALGQAAFSAQPAK